MPNFIRFLSGPTLPEIRLPDISDAFESKEREFNERTPLPSVFAPKPTIVIIAGTTNFVLPGPGTQPVPSDPSRFRPSPNEEENQ